MASVAVGGGRVLGEEEVMCIWRTWWCTWRGRSDPSSDFCVRHGHYGCVCRMQSNIFLVH